MKRIALSLITIAVVAMFSVSATGAYFSDQETMVGNTFAAGSLDLKVNEQDDVLPFTFSGSNLVPGQQVNAGTIELKNAGTIDGALTVKVSNPSSKENGVLEPELNAGDVDGLEIDPTGYDANTGDGELWDLCKMTIYFDMNNDGQMQWNEPTVAVAEHLDMTTGSGFRIPLNTNLWVANHGFDGVLSANETVHLGVLVTLKPDSSLISQPQYNGLSNNIVMTDSMSFDLVLGLEQVI